MNNTDWESMLNGPAKYLAGHLTLESVTVDGNHSRIIVCFTSDVLVEEEPYLYIRNAYQELALNNVEFKYKNPKIISSDEIDLAPTRPPILKISPSFKSLGELANNMQLNNTNKLRNMPQSESKSNKNESKFSSAAKSLKSKEILRYQKDIEKLNELKKQIVKDTKISKKRQFNNEVLNLFKYNPKINVNIRGGLDLNLFDRQKASNARRINTQSQTLVNAGERAILSPINKVNTVKRPAFQNYLTRGGSGNRNYNFRYDGNGNLIRNNFNRKNNLKNLSFSRDNNSFSKSSSRIEITNTSPLENEVQKKVKTILKKDYIGRYKRSPYLRMLE